MLLFLVSAASAGSPWCRVEYEAVLQREIDSDSGRVVVARLDDAKLPPLLAAKRHIELRARDARGLRLLTWDIKRALEQLPVLNLEPKVQRRYAYSRLALIISGILDEVPVPAIRESSSLSGRQLVELYRAVDRLLRLFNDACTTLVDLLTKASGGPMSYPSIFNLRQVDLSRVNVRLMSIAHDMRDVSEALDYLLQDAPALRDRLRGVATICAQITVGEDAIAVALGAPRRLRAIAEDEAESSWVENTHRFSTYDVLKSPWSSDFRGEVTDLQRVVAEMNHYRTALAAAISIATYSD